MALDYSLYFHIPFCKHRCAYCDFNTVAGREALIPAYVDALCWEIEFVGRLFLTAEHAEIAEKKDNLRDLGGLRGSKETNKDHPTFLRKISNETVIKTIFFGGGTPSLLTAGQFERIFQAIHTHFNLSDPEISLEANPGTVSLDYLQALREIGFNRISFGVQSAQPEELRQLERIHDYFDVIDSVKWARQAGFDNLNLDLIFGLPGQFLDRWQTTVKRAVGLNPEHLSLYALTVEHGTPFGRWAGRGLIPMPDPDLAAEMYEWAGEYLEAHGYQQYEISNWARELPGASCQVPKYACQHNLQTWRNQPYLGFGAGAHGYAAGVRYSNVLRIKPYLDRLSLDHAIPDLLFPASVNHHRVSRLEEMQETMMLGLRLVGEGVSEASFRQRFGLGIAEAFPKEVDELLRLGLVEWVDLSPHPPFPDREGGCRGVRSLRLTPHARLVANQVFMRFAG